MRITLESSRITWGSWELPKNYSRITQESWEWQKSIENHSGITKSHENHLRIIENNLKIMRITPESF